MALFDTHFHYYGAVKPSEYYDRAAGFGVKYLLAAGSTLEESRRSMQFAEEIENSWFSCGIHPHEAEKAGNNPASAFEEFRKHQKLAAIGEIGLDYFYEHSERKIQRKVFGEFLKTALDWKRPAIVHCRDKDDSYDAYSDSFDILKDFSSGGGRFVVHCFAGDTAWAEKFLELGAFLGITGIVTFPKAVNIRETLKVIPMERLLLETDTPYLAPIPYRGKENHSAYLVETAKKTAEEKNLSLDEISSITTANAFKFFSSIKKG
ncbi:MAG: hypothetical protein A2020_01410 [Lentisphaerae bacterium GWF2_45_14]|nr:MAG: hypothetical protein A2020_01410 [Lentisphaerae bacterium GWF2_45_14]